MRTNRLKNIDNVFLLGAGASFAMSLPANGTPNSKTTPLDKSFNQRVLELKSRKNWVKDAVKHFDQNWVGQEKLSNLGLEEAILKRAGNHALFDAIHSTRLHDRRNGLTKCENSEYIQNLSHLITEVLFSCRQASHNMATDFAHLLFKYNVWFDRRRGRRRRMAQTNRVITFNYDTILDREILKLERHEKCQLYFDRIGTDPISASSALDRRPIKEPFPFLVKLHGSTNWRVHGEDFISIVDGTCTRSKRIPVWTDDGTVPTVKEETSPLIVPPLPNKPITGSSIFSHLWQCAFEYLHEAKRIVIVGYSCPQTDSYAMSLLSNLKNPKVKEVVVIDPAVTTLNKYRRLLSTSVSPNIRWVYFDNVKSFLKNSS